VRGDALLSPVDNKNPPLPVIFGLKGVKLTPEQERFFKDVNPLGFILFGINGNIQDPSQLSALTGSLQNLLGRGVPILIDQEGGRVARLRPPHWDAFPAARTFGDLAVTQAQKATDTAYEQARAMAAMILKAGFNVNCAPVLDVLSPGIEGVIGDRAFSSDPEIVARLGAAVCAAHIREGVNPVVKHMLNHGEVVPDSHIDLPVSHTGREGLEQGLYPYRHILKQDFAKAVWGMVAHIVYTAIDRNNPATCSPAVLNLIRRDLGFDGFLLSDDIVMGALSCVGDMGQRAAAALRAGCDAVLHCNGEMKEMEQVARASSAMSPEAARRFNASII
jgi:beta-N-acetylhexosaminidase